jgi:hypothetical protein
MPAAQGEGTWGPAGVAYLEADRRIGPIAVSAFTSRMAWTRIPGGALRVAFIREDFSQKVAKLLGGEDVDVESHEFNQRWRVRADDPRDAHALLNPRVIEALLQIGDSHVAFTIAGDRAVLWDDGSEADVDLNARVSTLESLVGAIAPYLRGR